MKKLAQTFTTNNYILFTLGILFVFGLWFLFSLSIGQNNLYFPNPIETFKEVGVLLQKKYIYQSMGWTLLRTLIGFLISFASAMVLGLLAGNIKPIRIFLKPLITVLKSIPTAALVFLFLVMSGSRYAPIYIVFLLSFPILYESFVGGIDSISSDINDALKIDSDRKLYGLFKVKIPLAFPYVIVGLASSFALSLKTEVMAEIITGGTDEGLGCAIQMFRNNDPTNLTPVFAIAFIIIVFVLIVDLIGLIIKRIFEK